MGLNTDITVHGWRVPTLELSLVAGGDLAADTKYYVIGIMAFTPKTYVAVGSPPSDAYDITTTATHRSIQITQKTYRSITAFADNGDSRTLITCARHCVADNVISNVVDTIKIGTGSYTGSWAVDEWVDYDQFIIDTPYVDNVPVQFYTDYKYYNKPKINYGFAGAQGMAYYVGTINPYDNDAYWQAEWWNRRAHITSPPNPTTITAQPTEKFGAQCAVPQTGRYNKGVFKCLEPYGIPTIEIFGATNPSAILSEVQSSGFIYNFGYEEDAGYNQKPTMDCMSSVRCHGANSGFSLAGASIILVSEIFHTSDASKLDFTSCGLNFIFSISSAYWFFTAPNAVVYNNSITTSFQGWVHGDNVLFYASPRIQWTWGDGFDTYIDEVSGEEMSYSMVINKEFRECSPQTTLQNPYNQVAFYNCKTYPFYWILNGSFHPPIYMLENVIINWSGAYNWHFRFFNYNNTGYPSVLKFLNVNCPDNEDNHKDTIHNSTLNLTCLFYRRIEIYVQDNEGVELSGAEVTFTDGASNEYTDTTDINGYVYLDILEQMDVMVDTEPIYTPPTVTIYTDFVIEISKDGYNDYIAVFDNMYTNEKQSIAMVEPVYIQQSITGAVTSDEVSGEVSENNILGEVVESGVSGAVTVDEVVGVIVDAEVSGGVE